MLRSFANAGKVGLRDSVPNPTLNAVEAAGRGDKVGHQATPVKGEAAAEVDDNGHGPPPDAARGLSRQSRPWLRNRWDIIIWETSPRCGFHPATLTAGSCLIPSFEEVRTDAAKNDWVTPVAWRLTMARPARRRHLRQRGHPWEVFDAAKAMIKGETGLIEANVPLAANHNHLAKSARSPSAMKPDPELSEYQRFLARRIADGGRRVLNDLEPARIARGSADVPDQVFNRRWLMKPDTPLPDSHGGRDKAKMNPGRGNANLLEIVGPTDPQVSFLSVQAKDGRPIALLTNYSLHCVGSVPKGHISADYFAIFPQPDRPVAQGR